MSIERNVLINKEGINSFPLFFDDVRSCDLGKYLNDKIRWGRFKEDDVKNEEWVETLGFDVHNLEHMIVTERMTSLFIREQNIKSRKETGRDFFTKEESKTLKTVACIHDLAEAIVGDIPAPEKTEADEKKELIILKEKLKDIFQKKYPIDFSDEKIEEYIDILKNKESKLGRAFNAIEFSGYFRTAINAWKESKKEHRYKENLKWLTNDVLSGNFLNFLNYSKEYAFIENRISKSYKEIISEAFAEMPENILEKHKEENRDEKRINFNKSRVIWNEWLNNQTNEFSLQPRSLQQPD